MNTAQKRVDLNDDASTYALKRAILVYANGRELDNAYATSHPVTQTETGPVIGAGTPISKAQVKATFGGLLPRRELALLPANVLGVTQDATVWWTPARKAPLHVNLTAGLTKGRGFKSIGAKGSHMVAYPPLLHCAGRGSFAVFALKDDARPTAASELFHAPFLNLYSDGRLCYGTVRLPDPTDPDVQAKCEAMLFDSWSTHPNFDQVKQTLHPGGILALLDELAADNPDVFPTASLAPIGATLGAFFAANSSH